MDISGSLPRLNTSVLSLKGALGNYGSVSWTASICFYMMLRSCYSLGYLNIVTSCCKLNIYVFSMFVCLRPRLLMIAWQSKCTHVKGTWHTKAHPNKIDDILQTYSIAFYRIKEQLLDGTGSWFGSEPRMQEILTPFPTPTSSLTIVCSVMHESTLSCNELSKPDRHPLRLFSTFCDSIEFE